MVTIEVILAHIQMRKMRPHLSHLNVSKCNTFRKEEKKDAFKQVYHFRSFNCQATTQTSLILPGRTERTCDSGCLWRKFNEHRNNTNNQYTNCYSHSSE